MWNSYCHCAMRARECVCVCVCVCVKATVVKDSLLCLNEVRVQMFVGVWRVNFPWRSVSLICFSVYVYECLCCVCILDSLILPSCLFFFAWVHQWECHAEEKCVYYLWCECSNVWTGGHLYHLFTFLLAGWRLFIFASVVIPPLFCHPTVLWGRKLLCPPSLCPIFLYFTFVMLSLYFLVCCVFSNMCCGSHQDVIYLHFYYFWILVSISFQLTQAWKG